MDEHDVVFKALADPTRRALLDELHRGAATTGELCAAHPEMSRFGVMDHLRVLHEANLIVIERVGRTRINHLNPVPLREVYARWVRPIAEAPADELLALKGRRRGPSAHDRRARPACPSPNRRRRKERMMALMPDSEPTITFDIHAEVRIAAPVEIVWRSLVEDVGAWWPHSFSDEPRITMEPWVGGRFMEEWEGGSALYALVTHMVTGARLTISGPMGMRGARQYVKTYELAADGDGTVVTTTASMLGDIDDKLRENYTTGGAELLRALKAHAESKVA